MPSFQSAGHRGYDLGFYNTGTAGIFGAVATIMKSRGAKSAVIESHSVLPGRNQAAQRNFSITRLVTANECAVRVVYLLRCYLKYLLGKQDIFLSSRCIYD